MKIGQACTYRDSEGRSFSALIENITECKNDEGKNQKLATVVYKQSGKDRRAELVPKSQISNVHDVSEDIIDKIEKAEEELISNESNTTDDDYVDN